MVITGVENWSPDTIPVAFERKFDENLNEIPPGIYKPHIVDFFQYWGWEDWHKNTKIVINGVKWGPPWPEFCMHLSFISTKIFLSPKVFTFNSNMGFFEGFGGS